MESDKVFAALSISGSYAMEKRMRFLAFLIGGGLLVTAMTGCAALRGGAEEPATSHSVPLQVQVDQLRMDVGNLHRVNQNLAHENAALRQQLNNLTVNVEYLRSMATTANQDMTELKTQNAQLRQQVQQLRKAAEAEAAAEEAREKAEEEKKSTKEAKPSTGPAAPKPQQTRPVAPVVEFEFEDYSSDPSPLYDQAMNFYRIGEFPQALIAFDQVFKNFPTSNLADNSLYWIGEIYYAQNDYVSAFEYFDRVTRQYPDGSKTPDAYLKKGFALERQGKYAEALDVLNYTANMFPDHPVLPLAEQMIRQLTQ